MVLTYFHYSICLLVACRKRSVEHRNIFIKTSALSFVKIIEFCVFVFKMKIRIQIKTDMPTF